MKYFRIQQDTRGISALIIRGLMALPNYHKILQGDMSFFPDFVTLPVESKASNVYTDILSEQIFIVKEQIFDLMMLLNSSLRYKTLFLSDYKYNEQHFYYVPLLPVLDCLSDSSQYKSGNIEEKIIIRKLDRYPDMFIVKPTGNKKDRIVIVALPLAEAILRRNPMGVRFERVEIDSEETI